MNLNEVKTLAAKAHEGQKYNGFPYTYHLQHVELIALRFGHDMSSIQQACYLHDILEDTKTTSKDLLSAGIAPDVIDIVERVTDGPGKNRKERKADMYPRCAANPWARIVKLCDRIANVEEAVKGAHADHLQMYLKEHDTFKQFLEKPYEVHDMWRYLEKLFEVKFFPPQ